VQYQKNADKSIVRVLYCTPLIDISVRVHYGKKGLNVTYYSIYIDKEEKLFCELCKCKEILLCPH
jgi:hypothetical protein